MLVTGCKFKLYHKLPKEYEQIYRTGNWFNNKVILNGEMLVRILQNKVLLNKV